MKTSKIGLLLLIVLSLGMSAGSACSSNELSPPPVLPSDSRWDKIPTSSKKSPVGKIALGKFTVELESTSLLEVQKIAGVGKIQHRGDAGDSEYWICYTTSYKAKPQRIWFSSGEMGGDDHIIQSFHAKAGLKKTESCPQLPGNLEPVSLDNSLWLGSSWAKVRTLFGKPSAKYGNWWIFSYAEKVYQRHEEQAEQFDLRASLEVEVKDGRVFSLSQSQLTSN